MVQRLATVCLLAVFLAGISLSDDLPHKDTPPPVSLPAGKGDPDVPKTLADGLARLEKVLGRYRADDQHEWRLPNSYEQRSRPDPAQPEVLVKTDATETVGLPFVTSEGIAFDDVLTWKRQVYDLGTEDKKTLTSTQRTHNVTRYKLTLTSGTWLVSGEMLSNGVHSSQGRPSFAGVVRWHTDGFEFLGNAGVDQFYAAGGKLILGTAHGSTRYVRDGERLVMRSRYQPYYLATDPNGATIIAPDFKRPIGSVIEFEARSETDK